MNCPSCGKSISKTDLKNGKCPHCGKDIGGSKADTGRSSHKAIIILCWIIGILTLMFGLYKGYYWIRDYNINRLYTRGVYAPTVTEVKNSAKLQAHNIVYYGRDGDCIFIPELNESIMISGGVARFELQDSDWFRGLDMAEADVANITLTPILCQAGGKQTLLPELDLTIEAPYSPLTVTSPTENGVVVYTSSYNIGMSVYPGSNVTINGEDISGFADSGGTISLDVNVEPIGDNDYTILVKTENHKETRHDIMIYRQDYDIDFELTSAISYRTRSNTMTVAGKMEEGAYVTVDSDYVEGSLTNDMTNGEFSFITQFTQLGWNGVRFKLQKEGREDAVISFNVYYVPSLAAYSAKAWKMDYAQLRLLYEQWEGRVFKCVGPLIDIFTDDDGALYYVMDVTKDDAENQQLLILRNDSSVTSPSMGPSYTAYADVAGRYMYNSYYYPLLICRYLDLTAN